MTSGFAEVDTGLVQQGTDIDVRCELLAVARASQGEVTAAVVAAASTLTRARGVIPAQPGTLLPNVVKTGVPHGMLIAPYLWGGQTPQLSAPRRLTLVCQLLMLTDAEYSYAREEGVAAFQQAVADNGIDILDWSRRDR